MASECTCTALRTVSRKVTALYDGALEPFGVTVAQYGLLRRIARLETPSVTELAVEAELDRSTVGRNVRLLERMGLVILRTGEDQREASIALSDAGRATLRSALGAWEGAQRVIEAKIGVEAAAALRSLAAIL